VEPIRFGPTHYNVLNIPKRVANDLTARLGGTWNTYENHPFPYWLDDISVDFWGEFGRGNPIGRIRGWKVARELITRNQLGLPICYIRWRGRIWHPKSGWYKFNPDGIDHNDHVHVTFDLPSQTSGGWCPWRGN
jgi:hypothetical protein